MKILANSALVLALATLLTYSGCKPDDPIEPPITDVQLEKVSGTWNATGTGSNVTLDGISKKSDYSTFKLEITGNLGATEFGYSTTGRPALSPWPSSGQWSFDGTSPEAMIIRDPGTGDELIMTYSVSGEQLQVTFNFTKAGYSRTKKVTGEWIFTLAKE
jgi:hypothetical protein